MTLISEFELNFPKINLLDLTDEILQITASMREKGKFKDTRARVYLREEESDGSGWREKITDAAITTCWGGIISRPAIWRLDGVSSAWRIARLLREAKFPPSLRNLRLYLIAWLYWEEFSFVILLFSFTKLIG